MAYTGDRSWMRRHVPETGHGVTSEFRKGVEEFLDYAYAHTTNMYDGKVRCPCSSCDLLRFLPRDVIADHLLRRGFTPWYCNCWYVHGEPWHTRKSLDVEVDVPREEQPMALDAPGRDDPQLCELMKATNETLYEGCKVSGLTVVLRFLKFKMDLNIPEHYYNQMMSMVKSILPEGEKLPANFYSSMRFIDSMYKAHNEHMAKCRETLSGDWADSPPEWLYPDVWNMLINVWTAENGRMQPTTDALSCQALNLRSRVVRHMARSNPIEVHKDRMTEKLRKRPVSDLVAYNETHKNQSGDSYVDKRSTEVELYDSLMPEKFREDVPSQPASNPESWKRVIGDPNKRRILGFGSKADAANALETACSATSSCGAPASDQANPTPVEWTPEMEQMFQQRVDEMVETRAEEIAQRRIKEELKQMMKQRMYEDLEELVQLRIDATVQKRAEEIAQQRMEKELELRVKQEMLRMVEAKVEQREEMVRGWVFSALRECGFVPLQQRQPSAQGTVDPDAYPKDDDVAQLNDDDTTAPTR